MLLCYYDAKLHSYIISYFFAYLQYSKCIGKKKRLLFILNKAIVILIYCSSIHLGWWMPRNPYIMLFLMLIGQICHVTKTTKMADSLNKNTPFRQKHVLHHYECILLVKLLWQNHDYQPILSGNWDWSLRLMPQYTRASLSCGDPCDPSWSIWLMTLTMTNVLFEHKYVQNTLGF